MSIQLHIKDYHETLFGKIFGYNSDHKTHHITDHCILQLLVEEYLTTHGSGTNIYPVFKYFQNINGYAEHWVNKICWGSKDNIKDLELYDVNTNNKDLLKHQYNPDFYKNTLLEFIDKVKQYSELITDTNRLRSVLQVLCIDNIKLINLCLKELRISDYKNITDECIDKYLEEYMIIISEF